MSRFGARGVVVRARRTPLPVEVKKPERMLTDREKQQVKRMIGDNLELKYVNSYLTEAASTSGGVITGCTDVPQGDGDSDRSGDRIKICGTMEIRGSVRADVATGAVSQTVAYIRTILFQWHPTSDSTFGAASKPTLASILLNGPSGAPDVYSFYAHDSRQNYSILYDETFKPQGIAYGATPTISGNTDNSHYFSRKVPLAKKVRAQLQYSAASSVIATNHIYMMTLSNLASQAQNPRIVWSVKIFYRDG